MIAYRTFSAGEAAFITGVSTDVQRSWRKRGVLPANAAAKVRFTAVEAFHLRILRGFSEAGVPLLDAGRHTARLIADTPQRIEFAFKVARSGLEVPPQFAAVLTDTADVAHAFLCEDLASLHERGPFRSIIILNLSDLAAEVVREMATLADVYRVSPGEVSE